MTIHISPYLPLPPLASVWPLVVVVVVGGGGGVVVGVVVVVATRLAQQVLHIEMGRLKASIPSFCTCISGA